MLDRNRRTNSTVAASLESRAAVICHAEDLLTRRTREVLVREAVFKRACDSALSDVQRDWERRLLRFVSDVVVPSLPPLEPSIGNTVLELEQRAVELEAMQLEVQERLTAVVRERDSLRRQHGILQMRLAEVDHFAALVGVSKQAVTEGADEATNRVVPCHSVGTAPGTTAAHVAAKYARDHAVLHRWISTGVSRWLEAVADACARKVSAFAADVALVATTRLATVAQSTASTPLSRKVSMSFGSRTVLLRDASTETDLTDGFGDVAPGSFRNEDRGTGVTPVELPSARRDAAELILATDDHYVHDVSGSEGTDEQEASEAPCLRGDALAHKEREIASLQTYLECQRRLVDEQAVQVFDSSRAIGLVVVALRAAAAKLSVRLSDVLEPDTLESLAVFARQIPSLASTATSLPSSEEESDDPHGDNDHRGNDHIDDMKDTSSRRRAPPATATPSLTVHPLLQFLVPRGAAPPSQ